MEQVYSRRNGVYSVPECARPIDGAKQNNISASAVKTKKQEHFILKEYDVDISGLFQKNRKSLNILVIPFDIEEIAISFMNTMFRVTCIDIEYWKNGILIGE
jgi:hypothetical protein